MGILRPMRSTLLPKLASIRITEKACVTSSWCIPLSLKKLDISLGFRPLAEAQAADAKCDAAVEYLEEVEKSCMLETFHFRGRMSERLNQALASLTTLSALHLNASKYLTAQTIASIAQFPSLHTLNIWAQHIDADEVVGLLPLHSTIFPALEDLHIETKAHFVNALLPLFSTGRLRKLRIEVDNDTIDLPVWQNVFEHIQAKFSTSLKTLDIIGYQHLDLEDDDDDTSDGQSRFTPDTYITMHTLQPLASLRSLERLAFTAQLPVDLTNDQLIKMVKWWPLIETIDFGRLPRCFSDPALSSKSSITPAVFLPIAKACSRLETLSIPVNINASSVSASAEKQDTTPIQGPVQHPMQSLCFGRIIGSVDDTCALAGKLLEAFPSIAEVMSAFEDKSLKSGSLDAIIQELRSCAIDKA